MNFDIANDPTTDNNQCDDCTGNLNSSSVEFGDSTSNTGDLSLVSINSDLEVVVWRESERKEVEGDIDTYNSSFHIDDEEMEIENENGEMDDTDDNCLMGNGNSGGTENDNSGDTENSESGGMKNGGTENGESGGTGNGESGDMVNGESGGTENGESGGTGNGDNGCTGNGESGGMENGDNGGTEKGGMENGGTENGDNDSNSDTSVDNDIREIDRNEKRKVELFLNNGCGCTLNERSMCSSIFSTDHISSVRDQCSSFQRSEINNILLGHIMTTVRTSDMTNKVRNPSTTRVRNTTTFYHEGQKVTILIIN